MNSIDKIYLRAFKFSLRSHLFSLVDLLQYRREKNSSKLGETANDGRYGTAPDHHK